MAENRNITGYVAQDPKMVTTAQDRDLAVLRVLENNRAYDREAGEWKDLEPTGYDVAIGRDGLRENVLSSVQKGQRVSVEGRYEPKAYLDREGNPQVGHRIYANDVSASMMHDTQARGPAAKTAAPEAEVSRQGQQRGPEQEASSPAGPVPQVQRGQTPEAAAMHQEAVDSWAQVPTESSGWDR